MYWFAQLLRSWHTLIFSLWFCFFSLYEAYSESKYRFTVKKKQVALIMLIIALQFDVSTSFNM